jgi:hypothetical protein
LGIHNVINVNNLKLFEPPLLDEPATISHPVENIPDFQLPILQDTIFQTKSRSTCQREYISYLLARKGQTPTQAKWMTTHMVQRMFPHVLEEARMLPDLNRDELGHKEANIPYNPINKIGDNVLE